MGECSEHNQTSCPRWPSWISRECVEFLTTLSGTFYTLLLRDELMEVEIRLAKGEYFQTHPSCVPESKGSLIEIQTFRLGVFPLARLSLQRL